MGAWGPGTFEDDMALDWLGEFEDAGDASRVAARLHATSNETEYLDASEGSETLAAAEVVAAALGNPLEGPVAERLIALGAAHEDLGALSPLAVSAVRVVRSAERSELHDLWHEEEEGAEDWDDAVDDLLRRLAPG